MVNIYKAKMGPIFGYPKLHIIRAKWKNGYFFQFLSIFFNFFSIFIKNVLFIEHFHNFFNFFQFFSIFYKNVLFIEHFPIFFNFFQFFHIFSKMFYL